MKIKKIDELLLEQECNRIVKEFNLPRKEWCNAKTILNGMYEYAVRKKYLTENPMNKVQILVKFRQVFTSGKLPQNRCNADRSNSFSVSHKNIVSFLAVKVNFLLGLRVGELVALKWCDLCDSSHLHIVREEIRDQCSDCYGLTFHGYNPTARHLRLSCLHRFSASYGLT